MNRQALDELKQQIPLLNYLRAQHWQPTRRIRDGRLMGMCPLHADHKPSFLLDPHQNLFYCYGCGRGGDVIRFAELYHQLRFPQAVARLRDWCGVAPLLQQASNFYRMQLPRHSPDFVIEQHSSDLEYNTAAGSVQWHRISHDGRYPAVQPRRSLCSRSY